MKEIKNQVENLLRNYTAMKNEVQVLEYELKRFAPNLRSEIIRDLTFSRHNHEHVSGTHISDKTANIAIEHCDSQINGEYHALRTLISNMRFTLHRIDYYLSLIPEKEASVIKQFYFEKLTLYQISDIAFCVPRTLQRWKEQGLEKLSRYYMITDKIDSKKLDLLTMVRFVSYIHEERFTQCLKRVEQNIPHNVKAFLYIISGCNELWQVGIEVFYDFESGGPINRTDIKHSFSENNRELLRLAYRIVRRFDKDELVHILRHYFPCLEYIHLELAIEAVKLALFPMNFSEKGPKM